MSQIAKIVGERIRKLRNARGLSQEQLALRSNLNSAFVGQVERGEKSPSIDTLDKIASGMGIKLEELFNFENDMENKELDISDKIALYIRNRSDKEKEAILDIIKKVVAFKDNNE